MFLCKMEHNNMQLTVANVSMATEKGASQQQYRIEVRSNSLIIYLCILIAIIIIIIIIIMLLFLPCLALPFLLFNGNGRRVVVHHQVKVLIKEVTVVIVAVSHSALTKSK